MRVRESVSDARRLAPARCPSFVRRGQSTAWGESLPVNIEGRTLREIDERHGLPKGSAFRAFKRLLGTLRENVDFTLLPARSAGSEIERLRRAGRIYRSSVNVVVLAESGVERVRAELRREPFAVDRLRRSD